MKFYRLVLAAAFCAVATSAFPVSALAKEKNLGPFGGWRAYLQDQGGQTVCYMVTTKRIATKAAPKLKRATPYLMITHRPVEASTDVFSYGAGTVLDSRRSATIRVGPGGFELFSVGDIAWARDAQTDHHLAHALVTTPTAQTQSWPNKKGAKPIIDTFDLTGAAAAYQAIGKACGLSYATAKKAVVKKNHPRKKHKKTGASQGKAANKLGSGLTK